MNLAIWSPWRVLAMWAAWLFIVSVMLIVTIMVVVRWLRDRAPAVPPGETGAMNGFAIPISTSAARGVIILCLLPPAVLTIVWLWQRFVARR